MASQTSGRPPRRVDILAAIGIRPRKKPSVPPGTRVYAVGDVHGCVAPLEQLLLRIEDDAQAFAGEKVLIYVGDYVDRGPDSRKVVEKLLGEGPRNFRVHFLKGNHEAVLLQFLEDAGVYRIWRNFGGMDTLVSYGVRPPRFETPGDLEDARRALVAALPDEHLRFFRSLELTVCLGDYAFVHAGIRPGLAIDDQVEFDLLWIRDEFLNSTRIFDKTVVHGHTPVPAPLELANRIAIDTGVYATGVLSCVVLEGETRRFIQVDAAHSIGQKFWQSADSDRS